MSMYGSDNNMVMYVVIAIAFWFFFLKDRVDHFNSTHDTHLNENNINQAVKALSAVTYSGMKFNDVLNNASDPDSLVMASNAISRMTPVQQYYASIMLLYRINTQINSSGKPTPQFMMQYVSPYVSLLLKTPRTTSPGGRKLVVWDYLTSILKPLY